MALVFWIWDPYRDLLWGSGRKQPLMPLIGAGGMMCFVFLTAMRPWRRRLVFTPHALEYRRVGTPISIPWDTIDSLEPKNEGFAKTVKVTMRPPGQPPTLERKRFPDGTAQGKLAIHCMSVDPGTIYYALNRLWREPETRHLLGDARRHRPTIHRPTLARTHPHDTRADLDPTRHVVLGRSRPKRIRCWKRHDDLAAHVLHGVS